MRLLVRGFCFSVLATGASAGTTGILGDTMYLFPPLTVTEDEIDEMASILGASIDAVVG